VHPLRYLLRGTGRRRAADYAPAGEAECAQLRARIEAADSLIVSLVHERNIANRKERVAMRALEQAAMELEAALVENAELAAENDELAHRLIAADAELANLKPISVPAPADWPDSEADTQQLPVLPLWEALSPTAA
jgi:hypothetical protein